MTMTALVFAKNTQQKSHLVKRLTATGLFTQIRPIASIPALFQYLKTKRADVICWAMDKTDCKYEWINRLHAHEEWLDLPLIAFAEDQQTLLNGFECGASDALSLTIGDAELTARMHRHLQRWQRLLELRKIQENLHKMALTDPLTGLGNRATFEMSMKQISARTQRSNLPYSLMLIDLDHFKAINDTYGHQLGDSVLQRVARVIEGAARDADICCRYGGEEFAVILPDTSPHNAVSLARRIHRRLAEVSWVEEGIERAVTVSIGISGTDRTSKIASARLLREADTALYQAKRNGRNRTEKFPPEEERIAHKNHFTPPLAAGARFACGL